VAVLSTSAGDAAAASQVASDLVHSGRFVALQSAAFPQAPGGGLVQDAQWRGLGVDYLVVAEPADGGTLWHLHLRDLRGGRELAAYDVARPFAELTRDLSRQAADRVFESITGVPGAADARIAYVAVSGYGDAREYRLIVNSGDAKAPRVLAASHQPIMAPSWSPDGRRIAYVRYTPGGSGIYVQDLATGAVTNVTNEEGVNGAPAWSPDGSRLAVTLSAGNNTNIFVADLLNHVRQRLTDSRSIDTEATWSPDGHSLVFMSDRSGMPRLYSIASEGGPARLLKMPAIRSESPRYSPDGKSLALVARKDGKFRIGLLRLDSDNFNLLTDGPMDETPSFTPNGALLLYSAVDHDEVRTMKLVSLDGRLHRDLASADDVREPAWSPYIN
jgi:TolB protein